LARRTAEHHVYRSIANPGKPADIRARSLGDIQHGDSRAWEVASISFDVPFLQIECRDHIEASAFEAQRHAPHPGAQIDRDSTTWRTHCVTSAA
jgi:hypothetical protein